jgi:hypothetical protein
LDLRHEQPQDLPGVTSWNDLGSYHDRATTPPNGLRSREREERPFQPLIDIRSHLATKDVGLRVSH